MVRRLKEDYQNEDFVAFYKGVRFYTGKLGEDFVDSLAKLMQRDSLAYDSIIDYLDLVDLSDHIVDEYGAASTFVGMMYDYAVDGEDYWNFGGFEIFPEYELDESIRRKTTKQFKESYYDDAVSAVKELYEANDNYQNYILIRDFSRDEYDTIICDWDLSEDEVQAIKDAFERGEYDEKDRVSDDVDWMTFEEAQSMFNDIRVLV